jgi:hypothetical protein
MRQTTLLLIVTVLLGCNGTMHSASTSGAAAEVRAVPSDAGGDAVATPADAEPPRRVGQGATASPTAPVPQESSAELLQRTSDVLITGTLAVRGTEVGVVMDSIEDPSRPRQIGSSVLPGSVNGLALVRDGLVAAGCGAEGIFLIDLAGRVPGLRVGLLDTAGAVWRLERLGDHVLAADGHLGVMVADLRDPAHPLVVGRWRSQGYVMHAVAHGPDLVLVAEGRSGLAVLDISDPSAPRLLGRLDTDGEARSVASRDDVAFVADFHHGVVSADVSDPASPRLLGRLDTTESARDVEVLGQYVAVAIGRDGVAIVDASDPSAMTLAARYPTSASAVRITAHGTRLFVAADSGGMDVIDVADPRSPRPVLAARGR